MDSIAPPKVVLPDPPPLSEARTTQSNGPAAQAADRLLSERLNALRNEIMPNNLNVSIDADAGRFVQVLTDASTHEQVLKYPNETQLAYSRAVMAYMRAFAPR